ncbi:MAG: DNA polymerase III subunit [bacterium]|nr:DNA polymerase III subunit [bacterium]
MGDAKTQFVWPAIGQDRASAFLEKSLLSGKPAQTYIFSGPRDLGKATLALAFARNLWRLDGGEAEANSNLGGLDSDLYILERDPEKKQISVEQAREFNKRLGLSSFLNSYKIGIIKEAELLSTEAQNALLKTLEEPREKVVIILLVDDVSRLMPTISSRSQILFFYPVGPESVYDFLLSTLELKRSTAKEMAAAALGRPLQAKWWAENPALYKEHQATVENLFTFIESDLSKRLSLISEAGTDSSLDAATALHWIDTFESLWRDALLISLGQEDRLQYPALQEKWKKMLIAEEEAGAMRRAVFNLKQLQQAREYIRGNVNPKNILESLALYF